MIGLWLEDGDGERYEGWQALSPSTYWAEPGGDPVAAVCG